MFSAVASLIFLSSGLMSQADIGRPSQSLLNLQATFTQELPSANLNGAIPGVVMAFGDRAVVHRV